MTFAADFSAKAVRAWHITILV
ncbi:MAG: hypothetical protein RL716_740, partial [Actinomycetota bacterium]